MISSGKILKKYQVQPLKRLSQSFLRDDNMARKIVAAADIHPTDIVLEIGAGHGILTRLLAPAARQVIAVDIDPAMIAILEKELVQEREGNIRVIHKDILKMDIAGLCGELPVRQLKVIGNIPYAISTEILFQLLSHRRMISQTVLMVQREVADRLTGLPGTKAYGVPTVLLSMHARLVKLFDVPPPCFYPRPRVMSSVISLTFRERPRVELLDEVFFMVIVKAAFSSRRKTLWNNLRSAACLRHVEADKLKAVLASCGLDERIRGEALPVEIFGVLSNKLFAVL